MNPGGITETIWHFIGYLHLTEEVARSQTLYDGENRRPVDDDVLARLDADPRRFPDLEDVASQPVRFEALLASEALPALPKLSRPDFELPAALAVSPPKLALHESFTPAMIASGGFTIVHQRLIDVTYRDGGVETLMNIHQINHMDDRDVITSDGLRWPDGTVYTPVHFDMGNTYAAMIREAEDAVPESMRLADGNTTESIIAALQARETLWAETGSPTGDGEAPQTTSDGRFVNGERSDAPLPEIDETVIAPWREGEAEDSVETSQSLTIVGPSEDEGIVVEAGLNRLENAASIRDLNEMCGSLLVGGDYFFSRGIVQVNVLTDSDHIDFATSGPGLPSIVADGNEVHNVAEFVTHEITTRADGAAAMARWQVDVFRGDFYDVKAVYQFNDMIDGDSTAQTTNGTYFALDTGLNGQVNLAQVSGLDSYDVIVICGSYHRADWIYQINVVLDCDWVTGLSASDEDGAEQVTSGFNRLSNSATISTYDPAALKPMGDGQTDFMTALASGQTSLLPNPDWEIAGNVSGSMRVLYITGDYYDVNVVTQVNLLNDVDQVIQASDSPAAAMGAATGGNLASNEAIIIDPGALSTSSYLGGDVYEESVLIQTNIVTESDTVVIHDTQTLVPELVAFAAGDPPPQEGDCPPPPQCDQSNPDNMLGNIMA